MKKGGFIKKGEGGFIKKRRKKEFLFKKEYRIIHYAKYEDPAFCVFWLN